jgi:hypothetical protein
VDTPLANIPYKTRGIVENVGKVLVSLRTLLRAPWNIVFPSMPSIFLGKLLNSSSEPGVKGALDGSSFRPRDWHQSRVLPTDAPK